MSVNIKNADCIDFLRGLNADSVDLVLTDPPYNLGEFMKNRNVGMKRIRPGFFADAGWDDQTETQWEELMDRFFSESSRVLKIGGSIVVFMAVIKVGKLIEIAQRHGFYYKTTGIWHKANPMPRNMNLHFINSTESWVYFINGAKTGTFNNERKAIHDFIETAVTPKSEKAFGKHPTQKPLRLMEHFIELLSDEGEIVCDPFAGSGSTGAAAVNLKRDFVGCEIDPDYFEICERRLLEIGALND